MKYILIIFLVFISIISRAGNNYYVSSSGLDANSCSLASPCTINKINTITFSSGDSVLFKRGDVIYGSIRVKLNGAWMDGYGTGANPIISGFTTLSSWTSIGGGIYSSPCTSCSVNTNMFTIDGVPQTQSRYPNSFYLTYETFVGNNYIIDLQLTGTPDWTGGNVFIHNYHYIGTTNKITKHSGDTLYYTPQNTSLTGSTAGPGYGFFIINDSAALDTIGEWWYSTITQKMYLYYGGNDPNTHTIKASTQDTLFTLKNGSTNTSIQNIAFQGSSLMSVFIGRDTNINMRYCQPTYNGNMGILVSGGVNTNLSNNYLKYSQSIGILATNASDSSKNVRITSDTVQNSGTILGMSQLTRGNQLFYMGIFNQSLGGVTDSNKVDTSGGGAIHVYNYSEANYNSVDYFDYLLDDAGGIYSLGYTDTTVVRYIRGNSITNGIGNIQGTNDNIYQAYGIYYDNNNTNDVCDSNSISEINRAGIYIHNTRNSTFTDNSIYQSQPSRFGILAQGDDNTRPIKGNILKRNVFGGANLSGNTLIGFLNGTGVNFTSTFGTIDSNYYCSSSGNPFYIYNAGGGNYAYSGWSTATGDVRGNLFSTPVAYKINNSGTAIPYSLAKNYVDVFGKKWYNPASIPARKGIMFFLGSYFVVPKGARPNAH